jgi:hypothetical protein
MLSLLEPLILRSIDSRDKLFCKALSTAAFKRALASMFDPPTLTAAFISRANFCHSLA